MPNRFEQLVRPVALERRPEERARRRRRVGKQRPLLQQPVQQPARERPGAQPRLRGGAAHFRQVVEAPAQLARAVVRGKLESREPLHLLRAAREAPEPGGAAGVLPGDDRRKRAAVPGVPAGDARALHGEAGGCPARGRHDARELGERRADARDDLLGVVLDVADGVALRRDRDERGALDRAVGRERAGARRMAALVDGDVDLARHARAVSRAASSPARRSGAIDSTMPTPRAASSSASEASVTS